LKNLLDSIENLGKIVIADKNHPEQYRTYIIGQDSKKIRALSIEIASKYREILHSYSIEEDKDRFYQYKYEIFSKFIPETSFVFAYIEELLRFDLTEEACHVFHQLIHPYKLMDPSHIEEFIKLSGLYHLFLNCASLFLKHGFFAKFKAEFYHLTFKNRDGKAQAIIGVISWDGGGWDYVSKEIYKTNYHAKKFTIICENHLPPNISKEDFKIIDAYITMDLALFDFPYGWACGASVYYGIFSQVYYEYFDKLITSKDIAISFLRSLRGKYGRYSHSILEGMNVVYSSVAEKYKISENEISEKKQ
jgi:hypothetical protein